MAEVIRIQPGGKLAALNLTTALAAVAATSPATFANDGQTLLIVRVGATPTNLTITGANCTHGRPISTVIALAASTDYVIGPFPTAEYNDGNGKLNFSFSSIVAVTVGALQHNT